MGRRAVLASLVLWTHAPWRPGCGPDSKTELVLSTNLQYAPNWLVTSVQDAVADIVAAGGTVLVEPHEILVGRLAVVADPFGNALILLDRPSVATPPTQRAALQPWARAHDHPRVLFGGWGRPKTRWSAPAASEGGVAPGVRRS
jgi:hypothetical protein